MIVHGTYANNFIDSCIFTFYKAVRHDDLLRIFRKVRRAKLQEMSQVECTRRFHIPRLQQG
jgi:hypothetical protein